VVVDDADAGDQMNGQSSAFTRSRHHAGAHARGSTSDMVRISASASCAVSGLASSARRPTHTPFKVVDPYAISQEGDHGGPCRSQRVLSQPHRGA